MIISKFTLLTSFVLAVTLVAYLSGCAGKKNNETTKDTTAEQQHAQGQAATDYKKETTDQAVAGKLKLFLNRYLEQDLPLLDTADHKFSFYAVDLNDDRKDEYFIHLSGRYFCGTGGCTLLLLDNNLKLINRFTVVRTPVFRSAVITNGWHELIVPGSRQGTFVHLKWNAQTHKYPSNPTVVAETDIAPAGNDFVMWYKEISKAMPFTF